MTPTPPSPGLFFGTINAYQRTAALRAAIELDLFSAVGAGGRTAAELAVKCGTAERGVRILADYLTILGFLTKSQDQYELISALAGRSTDLLGDAQTFFAYDGYASH